MAEPVSEVWDPVAAAAVLQGIASGRLDVDDELGTSPVMVVDLDGTMAGVAAPHLPPPPGLLPAGFGRVVVGISHRAATATTVDCDIALTTAPGARRPWVDVADLAGAVGALRDRAGANPAATVVAAQLLRRGGTGTPDDDLLCESLAYSTLQGGSEFAAWLAGRHRRPPRTSAALAVLTERQGETLVITLNRPEVRNAYSSAMRDQLVAALQLAAADRTIRQVRLRGAGPAFCSGGDLDEFGTAANPAAAHLIRTARSAGWWLSRCASRVTATIHGACVGAGIELPAFAGRVEARPGTAIRLPEVAMGLVPGAGGTASIPRRVGRHRTAWLAISGAELAAETALAWGLVDAVVE